ncbi:sialate O-acetylesterase [uncultured Chitinophaga sp.]|uniref:sialate O-acetylesterase n=1 Tax=uncultured Chitinophaga sp. TaxID=339340 RepID=UPI00262A4DC5|nr:sialate O-acetylesterase [uncultured Chitinophaga sp.]
MKKITTLIFSLCLLLPFSNAQIRLPRLISNGMVLQRDSEVKIWGWAAPGEKVSLSFLQKDYTTSADRNGNWHIQLPPQRAGGPYNMIFSASNRIEINNILFGDVWLCSGQSNMELSMDRLKDKYPEVIAGRGNDRIRQFLVPDKYDFNQAAVDVDNGGWLPATGRHIAGFSAVALFFANELFEKYEIPIGLINAALGGSPVQAWISEEALKKFPAYYSEVQQFKDGKLITRIETKDSITRANWYNLLNSRDEGLKHHWESPLFNDAAWQPYSVPGYWSDKAFLNGAAWFRKTINVPAAMAGQAARLWLGRIVDADSVYINGVFVGTTGYQYPPRKYDVPAGLLKEGKNLIAVRVINTAGKGGFVPDKPYTLFSGDQQIDLSGAWKYQMGATMDSLPAQTFVRWKAAGLFNAMIAPLLNYSIKGAIWYQGESNTSKPGEYQSLFSTLIKDWRSRWKQGDFPFLFVQLANFMEPDSTATESDWAELRQQQFNTLSVPRTAMAVTIDLGEWNDIHPLNKKDVGTRLALQAMRLAYNDDKVVASGPLYQSMKIKGDSMVITFTNTGSGLLAAGDKPLQHFSIAGKDGKFVRADAMIRGKEVIVWNKNITQPLAVRYAWANNPEGANLYNKEGLPAAPFEAR